MSKTIWNPLSLFIKKTHPDAKIPTRAFTTDAGLDLYALEDYFLFSGQPVLVKTGIAMAIPAGWCGIIFDRSSMGSKGIHRHCGVIDSAYRGEIKVCLNNTNLPEYRFSTEELSMVEDSLCLAIHDQLAEYKINAGDKIAQMLFFEVPRISLTLVDELPDSDRGQGGFGSTGV